MKRIISILIFVVMVLVQTPVNELFKFTELIEHYTEHKNLDHHITIFDYLAMHYTHSDVQQPDHDRDMQLPFKQYNSSSLIFTVLPPSENTVVQELFLAPYEETKPLYRSPFHPEESLSNIWQPPRA
ncbi:MAG TPA: hypothetical protein VIN07_02030 [Flavipsychrobacter sp.]